MGARAVPSCDVSNQNNRLKKLRKCMGMYPFILPLALANIKMTAR